MSANVAVALELILKKDNVPHLDAESRAVDVALKEERPVRRFVCPFV